MGSSGRIFHLHCLCRRTLVVLPDRPFGYEGRNAIEGLSSGKGSVVGPHWRDNSRGPAVCPRSWIYDKRSICARRKYDSHNQPVKPYWRLTVAIHHPRLKELRFSICSFVTLVLPNRSLRIASKMRLTSSLSLARSWFSTSAYLTQASYALMTSSLP